MEKNNQAPEKQCLETLLCPNLSSHKLKYLYKLRYWVIRYLARPCPWYLPIIGNKSVLELLFLGVLYAIGTYICIRVGALSAGLVASFIAGISILCGCRNNLLTIILSISFERALYWHKVVAVSSIIFSGIHGYYFLQENSSISGENLSGIVLVGLMVFTSLIYVVKHISFEVFYTVHILVYVFIILTCFWHGAYVFGLSVSATVDFLPGDVVRLKFPKCYEYAAGQYCFVMLPSISMYQYHPFTISSAPHEQEISLHIRALGNWSNKLLEFVKKNHSDPNTIMKMDVYMEGPFGLSSIDFEAYDIFLLIAGGIGVTPTQSIFNDLVHKHSNGIKKIRKCVFIWSVKDKSIVNSMDIEISHDRQSSIIVPDDLPLSFQPDLVRASSLSLKSILSAGKENEFENVMIKQGIELISSPIEQGVVEDEPIDNDNLLHKSVFHCEFYLTAIRDESQKKAPSINSKQEQTHFLKGRPDLPKIFSRVEELCVREKYHRVGVISCGPELLMKEVALLASQFRGSGVCFDQHEEIFDF
eukprot:gene7873-10688_t